MKFVLILILPLIILSSCTNEKSVDPETVKADDPYILSKVKILTPKAGDTLIGWDIDTISWSYKEIVETIDLHYSIDEGNSWKQIVSNAEIPSGKFSWLVPNINTQGCKIMLTVNAGLNTRVIESEGTFSIQQRQAEADVLNYFPLSIGDMKIFKRMQKKDFQLEPEELSVKQSVVGEEVFDTQNFFHFKEDIINRETSEESIRNIYFRVDTSTNIVYQHSLYPEGIYVHLGLLPNEVFEIGTEHYTTLKEQNSFQIFNESFERKVFFRGDIYGYSGHSIELLDGIGVFAYSYSADYGFSVRDTLMGAVLNGIVYGDTTWVD